MQNSTTQAPPGADTETLFQELFKLQQRVETLERDRACEIFELLLADLDEQGEQAGGRLGELQQCQEVLAEHVGGMVESGSDRSGRRAAKKLRRLRKFFGHDDPGRIIYQFRQLQHFHARVNEALSWTA